MQDAMTYSGVETLPEYAKMLAKFGRFEDTYIVHAAEGETVVPLQVLDRNPALKEMLFNQMRDMGMEPERYIVGHELNSINPETGQPEFFFKELWSGVKKVLKVAAPVLGAIAGSFIPIPVVGPMIGSFLASKLAGYSTQSALMGAAASGIGAYGLGSSATAAAGGFTNGLAGIGGKSLGSALYSGLTQNGLGQGLAGLVTAAPAMTAVPTSGVPQAVAGYTTSAFPATATAAPAAPAAAASAVPTAAAAAAPATNFASGTVFSPLVNFGIKNPGLVLAGGAALASYFDKNEGKKMSKKDKETGIDVYNRDPGKYNIGNLGPAPVSYGDGSANMISDYSSMKLPQIPQSSYAGFSQLPGVQQYVNAAAGGHISGPGTGTSDDIPAMLSDGEFVFTAKAVRGAGGGDRRKGAREMYKLMRQFEASHG